MLSIFVLTIASLKQQVEGLQEVDRSVEILIYLLCTLPGWNEKNVQVQQQVIEVITYLASTATKFPKKCVVLCLLGVSERVADMKTRAHAMKCLTGFCEAIGPGFVFERLYKIMKEHKNPKVLSEGLLWMVSAIVDFGVSHLKLKDLIDFCKDTGLQSSAAATRNATIKLLGALHKFIGPDIKGFLTDVKPALLSALDVEYQKNPFEGIAVPKKTVRSLESTSLSVGGLDSLPREDVSGKVTPTLLKSLESPDWKVRLESIEAVNKILEEANKRIQPIGTGELFGALRGRLYDSNKNLVMATLTTIGNVASAMGPAVEKASKGILSDILKCLSDNKKHMREGTLSTLNAWNAAVHFDKMVLYITSALTDTKIGAEGRKDLFDWSARQLSGLSEFPDAVHLLKPAAIAMMDKSSDVRKAADGCIAEILRVSGQETIEKNLKDIQGPALALILERVKPYGSFQEFVEPPKGGSIGLSSKTSTKVAKSTSNGVTKHGNRTVTLRAIPAKGLKPDTMLPVQGISVHPQALLNVKDSNKEERERMVRRSKFEELRVEQIQELESDMMKYFREDLHRRLLSTDFKKQVDGLELLQKALPSIGKEIIEVLDILLRWFVLQLCKSNTTCLLKVLEFLPELFNSLKGEAYGLSEAEAAIFLPCLVEKLGHNIEKVREKMRELTKQIIQVHSAAKSYTYILDGLRSKNNRTRIECADLVGFFIDHHGAEISGQLKSMQIVASLTAERDGEIRKAALNALATGYKILGEDIWRYVGKLTDAQKSMLDDRFKWKVREMEKRGEGRPGEARAALRRSGSSKSRIHWVNWKRVCLSIEEGGLGVLDLNFANRVLLGKWVWKFANEKDSLWKNMICSIHNASTMSLDLNKVISPSDSWIWKGITRNYLAEDAIGNGLRSHSKIQVGNGKSIVFWHDVWLNEESLKGQFPRIYALSNNRWGKVSEFGSRIGNKWIWNIQTRRNICDWEMEHWIRLMTLLENVELSESVDDFLAWSGKGHGLFTAKACRLTLSSNSGGSLTWKKFVWSGLAPPRVETFLWQVSHRRLAVRSELIKRGVMLEEVACPLCAKQEETVQHLFISCQVAWELWSSFWRLWGVSAVLPNDPASLLCSWSDLRPKSLIWSFIPGVVLWSLWKARNSVVFDDGKLDKHNLFFICRFRLVKWFLAKYPNDFIQVDSLVGDPSLADKHQTSHHKRVKVQEWLPPPLHFFKVNVDGAVSGDGLLGGIGGILRDSESKILGSFSLAVGPCPPPLAEMKAIEKGIEFFLSSEWVTQGRLIIESDCKTVVDWILQPISSPPFLRPDVAEQSCGVSQSIPRSTFSRENFVQPDLNMERHIMPHVLVGVSGPTNWNEALDTISFGSPEQSVEGMKVVCHELTQATNDPEGSLMDELMEDADRLVSCLANKAIGLLAKTFDFSLTGASSRSCKYVLNTLMQTFQNKRLAHAVKENTLDNLITELLLWLLDERVPHMDDGSQLLKALNVLMLKILDNADRTSSFVVLINLLRPLDPSRWPSPATNETFAARNQKFSDLVVKCLIKLTKVLQSTIYDVDLDRILQSIHVYLQELGMEEIRRRAGADDKPLRMVKTVLHELVKLRGAAIKGHLSLVPIDMKPPPIILAYIDLNLETLAAARMLTSTGPGQTHWGDSGVNNTAPATNSADAQLKQELAAIFKKIGDKQTCTIGLYELYRITQLYPKVDIFAQLQNASEAFRTYIRDGLAQMEKNAAAGRTPSSVPMATPPPASLNASSPEFAPLSPVQTNSLNDSKSLGAKPEPTNFNLQPSYPEDNGGSGNAINTARVRDPENALADQRNERLMSGVTSGTLDAIRERMKSMQLAAAGGNVDEYATRPLMSVNDKLNAGISTQTRALDPHPGMDNPTQGGVLPMDEKALFGLQARMERLKSGGALELL
ncbi:Protein MOR1 [Hibiscus syriacus]|uniref:Protein MOR1 n=1 Tax=Hibiscus syriacus TaxID=106335 RepID=A0A6A2WEF3_HIBSY|nr:Protein MOR1 [Hibiscus syriacus]